MENTRGGTRFKYAELKNSWKKKGKIGTLSNVTRRIVDNQKQLEILIENNKKHEFCQTITETFLK